MSFSVNPWKVVEHGWNPDRMLYGESLTSLGNGYMGLRGSFEEDYSGKSSRGIYLGGVWYPDKTRVAWWKTGYPRYYGRQLNIVNLLGVHVTIDGTVLDLNRMTVWDYVREVDMRTGVYHRMAMVETDKGSMKLETWRFVSLARKELLAIRYTITPSFDAKIGLMPYLDGDVRNEDANYDEKFWDLLDGKAEGGKGYVTVKTRPNPFGIPRFAVSAAQACRVEPLGLQDETQKPGYCSSRFVGDVRADETVTMDKFCLVYTSRDHRESELNELAANAAQEVYEQGWDAALREHEALWEDIWRRADVQIDGDDGAQQGIRFNIFHLSSTYSGMDERLNIAPKGFTGERYGGATYWDTEAFCFPMFMAVAGQKHARQLLMYRYHQLENAYENARDMGLEGALFPMVTYTGRECHNEWEITFEEIHRNAAMVYAIYGYTLYTGDRSYVLHEGFEVLLGIARFWAGRAQFNERTGMYMLLGVTGPNEYENNVNNNWYTNRMAVWCLNYFFEILEEVGEELAETKYGLRPEETVRMRAVMENMYFPPIDRRYGVFEQQDGYFDKILAPASEIPADERPIDKHWSWDRVLRSCYIKQADVLMGMYFLDGEYSRDVVRRNFDFYEPMTVHESSLSPSIHSVLAARLGYYDKAVELYKRTARNDLEDINHRTEQGLHITSMPGSWLAIAQGFAGMRVTDLLSFSPFLPDCWTGYSFRFTFRDRFIELAVRDGRVKITLLSGAPVEVRLYGRRYLVKTERSVALRG